MDGRRTRVVLAGINGYGRQYLDPLLDEADALDAELVAVVDPHAERSDRIAEVLGRGIGVHETLVDGLGSEPDLVILATPIAGHRGQVTAALAAGAQILCEKPAAGTLVDCQAMARASAAAGRWCAVGFNLPFTAAVQEAKAAIRRGDLGAPRAVRCQTFWPRRDSYYQRSAWAGRRQLDDGTVINDSIAHNATAHFVFLPQYLLGEEVDHASPVRQLQAECYRVRPIESYDSVAFRATLGKATDWQFVASHAVPQDVGPLIHLRFEHGAISYIQASEALVIQYGGHRRRLSLGLQELHRAKLIHCLACLRAETDPCCTIQAASAQVAVTEAIHQSCPEPAQLDGIAADDDPNRLLIAPALATALQQTLLSGELPAEQGCWDWARPGRLVRSAFATDR